MKMNGKYRLTICLEGLYYTVVLAFIIGGGVLRGINLLFVLAGMMIGPLIYNWRMVMVSLGRLRVKRILPEGVCAGDLLVVEFAATGIAKRGDSSAIVVTDRIRRADDSQEQEAMLAEVFFPLVEAGKTDIQSYQGRLMERGRYEFGPFHVSTRFPLGLVRRTLTVADTEELIVFPRPGRLSPRWKQISQATLVGVGGSQSRQGLVEGDFYGLRDWRSGDSRRWIHWRTSARRNALAVRQFERPRSQDIVLLLDLWEPAGASDAERDNVELAISFAATVAEEICRNGGSEIGIGIAGREISWKRGAGSRPLLTEIMEQLAQAKSTRRDHLPELLAQSMHEIPHGTMTVVVGTRPCDLQDTQRFSAVWDDPALRNALREIRGIDVSAAELFEYFEVA